MDSSPLCFCPDFGRCRVTVMGLGRFGGGVGVVQFLQQRGAAVTVTDVLPAEELAESLAQIDVDALEALHLGGHLEKDFIAADVIVVNPAVPRSHPLLGLAREAGVMLTSEMNLFWQLRQGPVIGVTGSNGKSTTAAMIHSILRADGWSVRLGGNIGGSLLPVVDEIGANDWTILELSSFQLHDLNRLPSSPEVAVVTNFAPNHLDWHGGLDEYREAKQTIARWQCPDGISILNGDDPEVSRWCFNGKCYRFGDRDRRSPGVFRVRDGLLLRDASGNETVTPCWNNLPVPGAHNFRNAMAAAATGLAMGVPIGAIEAGLIEFQPLPHRLQFLGEWQGRRFYNDSLATTPESAIAALDAFEEPVVLLAGGSDKGVDLSDLAARITAGTKAVALMGETAEALELLIESERNGDRPRTQECPSFEFAFSWAVEQSAPGDVVLLSPGCASYDWFRNFAERGNRFEELVRERQNRITTPAR